MGHYHCDDHECHISLSGYTLLWGAGLFILAFFALAIYSTWVFTKSLMFWVCIGFVFVAVGLYVWLLVENYT